MFELYENHFIAIVYCLLLCIFMSRIRHLVVLLFLIAVTAVGRGQVVDSGRVAMPESGYDDSTDNRDSIVMLRGQVEILNQRLDSAFMAQASLRRRMRELILLKDSLVYLNDLYQKELQEKNRLMSEQVSAMQEKEKLVAEKEELYRQALTSSTIDRAKWEGDLKAKEASIEAKTREIDYLQKDIDAKEVTLRSQRENYEHVLIEKEHYRHLVDSLQKKVTAIEIENIRKDEENKYLQLKAKEAEEKAAITLNKKKKVRPIQGIAMRFYRTPDWDIRLTPRNNEEGKYDKIILNRNAGDIEFDFVTGASVMLWDMTDYFNGGKKTKDTTSTSLLPEIRRFDQKFNYDLGIYVGFGGSNLFKNFYIGPSFRFVDFFYLTIGVNICEFEVLRDGFEAGMTLTGLQSGYTLDDIMVKSWLVKPFVSLSIDLDFLSYIKK